MSYTAVLAHLTHGYKTWGFSEASPRVRIHYCGFNTGGICAALAARWIKNHASGDYGLPQYLDLKITTIGFRSFKCSLYGLSNITKVRKIGHDFSQWATVGRHNNIGQRVGLKNWLDRNGMTHIQSGVTDDTNSDSLKYLYDEPPQPTIERNIPHHLRNVKGTYVYLNFGKFAGFDHATTV